MGVSGCRTRAANGRARPREAPHTPAFTPGARIAKFHAPLLDARRAGQVRYIGFTGHKDPHIHLYMLQVAAQHDFQFDTAQMPLNVMDVHFRSFEHLVLPELVRLEIGVLGMKSMANGIILRSKAVTPIHCLHDALNLPTSVVITGCDSMTILDQALEAVRTFRPFSEDERLALIARTKAEGADGRFELFKTRSIFDSTATHPAWLGEEPRRLQDMVQA